MAEKHDLVSKITALVKEQGEELQLTDPVDLQSSFQELGFDWLAHTEFIMRVEEEFSLIISDEDAEALINVQSVIRYIETKLVLG